MEKEYLRKILRWIVPIAGGCLLIWQGNKIGDAMVKFWHWGFVDDPGKGIVAAFFLSVEGVVFFCLVGAVLGLCGFAKTVNKVLDYAKTFVLMMLRIIGLFVAAQVLTLFMVWWKIAMFRWLVLAVLAIGLLVPLCRWLYFPKKTD